MKTQLFALPEYDRAFARFVHAAVQELMTRKNPVLSMIRSVQARQVPTVRNTMPSGQVVENPPLRIEMPFTVGFKDAIAGDFDSLVVALNDAAEQGLKAVMPHFYEYLGRLCEAAGTSTDAKGQGLSHDLILGVLERMDIEFNENGNPIMPTLVMHPDTLEQLRKLPPPTEDQIKSLNELIERKRLDYNDRRRRRKLS